MRKQFLPALLLFATFALFTVGCDTNDLSDPEFTVDVQFQTLSQEAVKTETLDEGQFGDILDGTEEVFRSEDAFASFWEKLHADKSSVPDLPSVDFETQAVVAIVAGERPSGGFTVEVDDVAATEDGTKMRVRFTETQPGDNCVVPQVLTSPYVVFSVVDNDADVRFSGETKTEPC